MDNEMKLSNNDLTIKVKRVVGHPKVGDELVVKESTAEIEEFVTHLTAEDETMVTGSTTEIEESVIHPMVEDQRMRGKREKGQHSVEGFSLGIKRARERREGKKEEGSRRHHVILACVRNSVEVSSSGDLELS